jgi:hypothetical protein
MRHFEMRSKHLIFRTASWMSSHRQSGPLTPSSTLNLKTLGSDELKNGREFSCSKHNAVTPRAERQPSSVENHSACPPQCAAVCHPSACTCRPERTAGSCVLQRNGEVDMISIARDSGLVTVINSFDCEAGTREPGECVARCGSGTWRTARHRVSTEASTGPVS